MLEVGKMYAEHSQASPLLAEVVNCGNGQEVFSGPFTMFVNLCDFFVDIFPWIVGVLQGFSQGNTEKETNHSSSIKEVHFTTLSSMSSICIIYVRTSQARGYNWSWMALKLNWTFFTARQYWWTQIMRKHQIITHFLMGAFIYYYVSNIFI